MAFEDDWADEREEVIDDTLSTLRDQRDQAQELILEGSLTFYPYSFHHAKNLVLQEVRFGTSYATKPAVTFGQEQGAISAADVSGVAGGAGTNYEPFLVQPYIWQWRNESGAVDGFFIGLYAITPYNELVHGTAQHTLHWIAKGNASVYMDDKADEAWTESYDLNEPEYLLEDAGTLYIDDDMD